MIKKILQKWRRAYVYFLPSLLILPYIYFKIDILQSTNFDGVLESIITFVSITMGLFGVLIANIIGTKERSKMLIYFFETANQKVFVNSLKYNIMVGLLVILISSILLMKDILGAYSSIIVRVWIWVLLSYILSTYRFMGIMLSLLITTKKDDYKQEDKIVTGIKRQELNEKLKKGINK